MPASAYTAVYRISVSQSVSLVLTKLRIRYKGDHKCRRAANTGLTLLPLTWPFYILRIRKIQDINLVYHGNIVYQIDTLQRDQKTGGKYGKTQEVDTFKLNDSEYADDTQVNFTERLQLQSWSPDLEDCGMDVHLKKPSVGLALSQAEKMQSDGW